MKQAYVLYATESYAETVEACVESLNYYTSIPTLVYMLNSDRQIKNATFTIRWDCDAINPDQEEYIDRTSLDIYKILIQRPLIVADALKYAETVAYIDSDSVATKYASSIFDMFDQSSDIPYFVEGIYDYLHVGDRGGAESKDDLSTTLEHPACELFGVDQYVRERYRQTGYFVANRNCIVFLKEWYNMCVHPVVLSMNDFYAPYNEETILNVMLWKYNFHDGLPYIYVNGKKDMFDKVNSMDIFTGEDYMMGNWLRIPASKERLLFYHGEKSYEKMVEMISPVKIMYLVPHLSTGGMPAFVLKTLEALGNKIIPYVVEYNCYSLDYVVQRNKIKDIVGSNFTTLYENKMQLFDVIDKFKPDVIHIHEPSERFDHAVMSKLFNPKREYKIVETCHDVAFDPNTKLYHPDSYAFCTPYHYDTFNNLPSYKQVIEYPIDSKERTILPTGKDVLNVGLWTPGKNQAEGIEIARKYPEFRFHFVGNQAGNFKDYWEPLMKDLPKNVIVHGERDNVDEFMFGADIFMFNSTWECNPLVLREAIGYGLPIIAHNLPVYRSRYDKYIQPIDTDLRTITANYTIPELSSTYHFGIEYMGFYKTILENKKEDQDVQLNQNFIDGPFLELKSPVESEFKVQFIDEHDKVQYENTIKSNSWVRLNRKYYTKWRTKIFEDNVLVYENELSYEGKRVLISFDSSSLGDTIAWMPYVLEFKKKHNCHVIVSTFWNKLFNYPDLELVEPGTVVNDIYGQYNLGWFYDSNKEPVVPNTIKLQEAATNILGLEFEEIKPKIKFKKRKNTYGKYVTIATNSTAGCKFWTREGWQETINYLHAHGYKVINVSKEDNAFDNCEKIDNVSIENTMSVIYNSEFFIGLSSGLSWLAWALDKQVVMISNFTQDDHEFDCIRITNKSVCHGCWNNPEHKFDKGDFDWCPANKNTPRHFECQRSITSADVISAIKYYFRFLPLPLLQ
jgi:autotransporter strand-loop-strand O-heptosyltransferase